MIKRSDAVLTFFCVVPVAIALICIGSAHAQEASAQYTLPPGLKIESAAASHFCGAGHQKFDRHIGGELPTGDTFKRLTPEKSVADLAKISDLVLVGRAAEIGYQWETAYPKVEEISAVVQFRYAQVVMESPARAALPPTGSITFPLIHRLTNNRGHTHENTQKTDTLDGPHEVSASLTVV